MREAKGTSAVIRLVDPYLISIETKLFILFLNKFNCFSCEQMGVYKSSKTMNSGELFFTNIYSLGFYTVRESRENTIPRGEGILGPLMPIYAYIWSWAKQIIHHWVLEYSRVSILLFIYCVESVRVRLGGLRQQNLTQTCLPQQVTQCGPGSRERHVGQGSDVQRGRINRGTGLQGTQCPRDEHPRTFHSGTPQSGAHCHGIHIR